VKPLTFIGAMLGGAEGPVKARIANALTFADPSDMRLPS